MNNKKMGKYGAMAEKALKEAVKQALKRHQQMGVPAVFMQDGKMVYLMPDGQVVSDPKNWKKSKN